jgi:ribosomal protein S18 acetylase RimI-like enzyme
MITIKKLPQERWEEFKSLRLEALQNDPLAFGSSYEEEINFTEDVWKKRISNTLFACHVDNPVGMISFVIPQKIKQNHIAEIFGVFVKVDFRNKKIGKQLIEAALDLIKQNKNVRKIKLTVTTVRESAVKLYSQSGFEIVGKLKSELKFDNKFYDAFVMEKYL